MMPATREAALQRLQAFVPRAADRYTRERNHDHGAGQHQAVSQLSPYLRHRLISEPEVVTAVLREHRFAAAEKFIQEVCWRSYWKGWLQQRPGIWQRYVRDRDAALRAIQTDSALRAAWQRACEGRTGIECFDHWCAELRDTGYLHNHARMWFASIWIFTLRLPWQLGADCFMQHLLDADAASNTLSWRWVAGLQTVGKHYLARAENIERYTQGRFNPRGQLDENAAPLQETEGIPAAQPLAPLPSVPELEGAWLLLISEDDCSFEQMLPASLPAPQAIVVLPPASADGRRTPRAAPAAAFAQGAVADAVARVRQRWPQTRLLSGLASEQALLEALSMLPHGTLLLAEPTVGSGSDALAVLRAAGRPLQCLRRDWDAAFWPHARRGFFSLREQIPRLLRTLGAASSSEPFA